MDVCLTPIPTPVGPIPTPIPYVNMVLQYLAIPTQFKTLLQCMPAHNLMTSRLPSLGNFPGILLGVASKMVMMACPGMGNLHLAQFGEGLADGGVQARGGLLGGLAL
jgi:hypothetical protein